VLRGLGAGGRARGPVVILDPDAPLPPVAGAVVVVGTVVPTMAPLFREAVAIVAEQGGILGHGAALARELGIPCVVGCRGARTALTDGDDVVVDAGAGLVAKL
jgi:pyruvate,water dikinase